MNFAEYSELRERIRQQQDGLISFAEAMADLPASHTANGVPVTLGLEVVDYNRNRTTVVGIDSIDFHTGLVWFRTANGGMFDGSRLEAIR
jgi:hypothetical protein